VSDAFLRIAVAFLVVAGLACGLMFLAFISDVALRSLVAGYVTPVWLDRAVILLFASSLTVLLVSLAMLTVAMWTYVLRGRV